MRYLIVLLLLLGVVSVACSAPRMSVESFNYDFGSIIQGEQLVYTFRFQNTGDDVLQIGNVHSSCGCTAAVLSAKRIAPGDMGELRLTFDSTQFKGAINKTVNVDTNDPAQAELTFSLYGNVQAELLVQPERVNWGRVDEGAELTSIVKLTNHGKVVVKLTAPNTTNPEVAAELNNLQLEPGKSVELKVSAKFPQGEKRLRGTVIIDTNYPKVPQIKVPISARLIQ